MLQQKAVVLGDLFVTVPARVSLHNLSFLFIPPCLQLFLSSPFHSHCSFLYLLFSLFPCCTFSLFPKQSWLCMDTCTYNNSNYLHNDLQVTEYIQTHFSPIWLARQLFETSRACRLVSVLLLLKGAQKCRTVCPNLHT